MYSCYWPDHPSIIPPAVPDIKKGIENNLDVQTKYKPFVAVPPKNLSLSLSLSPSYTSTETPELVRDIVNIFTIPDCFLSFVRIVKYL